MRARTFNARRNSDPSIQSLNLLPITFWPGRAFEMLDVHAFVSSCSRTRCYPYLLCFRSRLDQVGVEMPSPCSDHSELARMISDRGQVQTAVRKKWPPHHLAQRPVTLGGGVPRCQGAGT